MAASTSEYAVKINVKDGALEVTGPEKDWVDAKIEQLREVVVAGYEARPDTGRPDRLTPSSKRKNPKKTPAGPDSGDARPPARRTRGTGGRSAINEELQAQLSPDIKKEFRGYIFARRKAWDASQSAQAVIIATFLHDKLGMAGVDQHDLYTAYTVMGERSPGNIRSQLTNARQRARYFSGLSNGKMVLSHAGENFARFDSLDGAGGDE